MLNLVDRKRADLVSGERHKSLPPKLPESRNNLCGILQYSRTENGYDYYDVLANGCVYVYLLNPDGTVAAGYPAICQAKGTLGAEIPYSIGCDCQHP